MGSPIRAWDLMDVMDVEVQGVCCLIGFGIHPKARPLFFSGMWGVE